MSVAPAGPIAVADLPLFGYVVSAVSGNFTQQFTLQAFLGPVPAQTTFNASESLSSWVGSAFVTPLNIEVEHDAEMAAQDPPASAPASSTQSSSRRRMIVKREPRSVYRRQATPDQGSLETVTESAISITDYVTKALAKAGNKLTAEAYLKKQLSWKIYGAADQAYLDPTEVPIKIWVIEAARVDRIIKSKILWEATNGKPAALKEGESPALEAAVTADVSVDELEAGADDSDGGDDNTAPQ